MYIILHIICIKVFQRNRNSRKYLCPIYEREKEGETKGGKENERERERRERKIKELTHGTMQLWILVSLKLTVQFSKLDFQVRDEFLHLWQKSFYLGNLNVCSYGF
jgi:hypothetical protein